MEKQKKPLRDRVLTSLIMLYACQKDDLKGYEVIRYQTKDYNGNLMVTASLKKTGSSNDLKAITLDLKMLKALWINIVSEELWRPLLDGEFNNGKCITRSHNAIALFL